MRARAELAMAARSAKATHHRQQHRAEASCPATSATVAAARAIDAAPWARAGPSPSQAQSWDQQLQRSVAFPSRRQARPPPRRCASERNIPQQHRGCSEVAGGTVAGCAAVVCCFPCVMVEVAVLATMRAPVALCRRAARARRRGGGHRRSASAGQVAEIYELLVDDCGVVEASAAAEDIDMALPVLEDSAELDKEVWARFYDGGFWRSLSQLGDDDS